MTARIIRDKSIRGGDPVIQGTRWPTSIARSFDYDVAMIHDQYPHLSIDQIEAAIRFERSWHRRLEHAWRAWRQRLGAWIAGEEQ
ncbi:MAG: DUF433 domain-containing protein [Thermomicrobiales bacterium]